jgi:membrane associated rhomboid family serine protease
MPLTYLSLEGSIDYLTSLGLGALVKIVKDGEEVYRIYSMFFLHFDLLHLLGNLLVFGLISESLLRLLDSYRFLTTLFLSALAGSIASLYLSPYEYVIGASGGIFGLFGAYCVVKFTKNLPGTVGQRSNKMVVAVIVMQVMTEYFVDGIDSYNHVGGFVTGALCMAVYLYFAKAQSIYKSTKVEKGLAVILSGTYLWGLLAFLFKVYA